MEKNLAKISKYDTFHSLVVDDDDDNNRDSVNSADDSNNNNTNTSTTVSQKSSPQRLGVRRSLTKKRSSFYRDKEWKCVCSFTNPSTARECQMCMEARTTPPSNASSSSSDEEEKSTGRRGSGQRMTSITMSPGKPRTVAAAAAVPDSTHVSSTAAAAAAAVVPPPKVTSMAQAVSLVKAAADAASAEMIMQKEVEELKAGFAAMRTEIGALKERVEAVEHENMELREQLLEVEERSVVDTTLAAAPPQVSSRQRAGTVTSGGDKRKSQSTNDMSRLMRPTKASIARSPRVTTQVRKSTAKAAASARARLRK